MPKTKAQKHGMLKDMADKLTRAKSAVFVNFSGIPVKEIDLLRANCKAQGSEYMVTKKTFIQKSLADQGIDMPADQITGEVATIFGYEDEIVPAKLASDFAKSHANLKLLAGLLEGVAIDQTKVIALAKLPSRPELLAKAVGSIAAPLSGFVNVLQGNLRAFVYALNAIKESKQ